ncbi:MAG: hypothetical protein AB1757_11320 [Acidobacteriota bacterium]
MKRMILLFGVLVVFYSSTAFAQTSQPVVGRKTILFDVFIIDLKNQTMEELEKIAKEKRQLDKAVADGKIKIIAHERLRCLSGEGTNIKLGQRLPFQSGSAQNLPQIQYENFGLTLIINLQNISDGSIEAKYTLEFSYQLANFLDAAPAFLQRTLAGITKLKPDDLTPVIEVRQREPFWKAMQEKSDAPTANFWVVFSGKFID